LSAFFYFTTFIKNSIEKFEKHLKPQKRINKPRFYYEGGCMRSSFVPIRYRAYYVRQCL